jgi:hypothetical protein
MLVSKERTVIGKANPRELLGKIKRINRKIKNLIIIERKDLTIILEQ